MAPYSSVMPARRRLFPAGGAAGRCAIVLVVVACVVLLSTLLAWHPQVNQLIARPAPQVSSGYQSPDFWRTKLMRELSNQVVHDNTTYEKFKTRSEPPYYMYLHRSFDVVSSDIRKFGFWKDCIVQKAALELIKNTPGKSKTVVDIGGNIGSCSLFYAAMGFKVYSFEPAPSNYKMLAASIQANIDEGLFQASGESSVYLVPAGAGATEDSNTIYSEVGNYGNSIILPKNKDGQADGSKPGDILSIGLAEGGKFLAQEIHTVPIDTVVKERISYMKMDCQGYEIFALEGATTLFDTYGVDQVFFEYAPNWIVSVGRKPTEMLEFFDRHGYVIYNKGSKLAPEEFHSLTVGLGSSFTDLVAYSKKAYPDKA